MHIKSHWPNRPNRTGAGVVRTQMIIIGRCLAHHVYIIEMAGQREYLAACEENFALRGVQEKALNWSNTPLIVRWETQGKELAIKDNRCRVSSTFLYRRFPLCKIWYKNFRTLVKFDSGMRCNVKRTFNSTSICTAERKLMRQRLTGVIPCQGQVRELGEQWL